MTMKPQGKEKVIIDKDLLLQSYFQIEKIYNKTLDDELNIAFKNLEKAIGFRYIRTLEKTQTDEDFKKKDNHSYYGTNSGSTWFNIYNPSSCTTDYTIKLPLLTDNDSITLKDTKKIGKGKKVKNDRKR